MNFFDQQHQKKKVTRRLLCILIIILLILASILNVAIGLAFAYDAEQPMLAAIAVLNSPIFDLIPLWLLINITFLSVFIISYIIQYMAIRKGGIQFAIQLGAVRVDRVPKSIISTENIKRLLNVVDEISIASGIPKPSVYVLSKEQSLNAFVAGVKTEDRVLVLTKGAIEKFSREELQGVIGHEFGHLSNDDVSINIKLFCLIGCLTLIHNFGSTILNTERQKKIQSKMNQNQNNGNSFMMSHDKKIGIFVNKLYFIGLCFLAIGYLGVFFSRLMQKAVSRQREYLADACSVQFTRNNEALALALYRIHKGEQTFLHCKQKSNLNHLCLFPSEKIYLFSHLLSTHPPILDRIKEIYDGSIDNLELKLSNAPSSVSSFSEEKT